MTSLKKFRPVLHLFANIADKHRSRVYLFIDMYTGNLRELCNRIH